MYRSMSDSRNSPIPQDRVDANINSEERAAANREQMREQERYIEDQAADERSGTNPEEQPGIPDEPTSPAEGGD